MEALALAAGIKWLGGQRAIISAASHIIIHGDSQLIISFIIFRAKLGKREIVALTSSTKEMICRWQGVQVYFQHILQEQNP